MYTLSIEWLTISDQVLYDTAHWIDSSEIARLYTALPCQDFFFLHNPIVSSSVSIANQKAICRLHPIHPHLNDDLQQYSIVKLVISFRPDTDEPLCLSPGPLSVSPCAIVGRRFQPSSHVTGRAWGKGQERRSAPLLAAG